MRSRRLVWGLLAPFMLFAFATSGQAAEERVIIHSQGWQLIGDWQTQAEGMARRGTVLLLHKAAGNRHAYNHMAEVLAARGYASLRLDLRGHGDSTNVTAFDPEVSRYMDRDDPAVVANFALITAGDKDVVAAIRWMQRVKAASALPFAIIGSSYTGEEMAEAIDDAGVASAYIALAPGNFSDQSIARIDPSGAPWLFVRAEVELPFFPALFQAIDGGSDAEIWVLPGRGHATDLFETNEGLEERLADWLDEALAR